MANLRELSSTPEFETSTNNLVNEFYVPALSRSVRYDRGVGFFTSAWLKLAAAGLAALASNGGRARILASPILEKSDWEALSLGSKALNDQEIRRRLEAQIDELEQDLEKDTLAALAWMIADGLLEIKLAIPAGRLDGDFHDKFGVFWDVSNNGVAFHGSPNDSRKAFHNYESISVFYSWLDDRERLRVNGFQRRFDRLFNNFDENLRVYDLPDAAKAKIVRITEHVTRPYPAPRSSCDERWRHQQKAVQEFIRRGSGVLEMATGTGKTRTALMILDALLLNSEIQSAVVVADGTDLLDQWYATLCGFGKLRIYRFYGAHKEMLGFINDPSDGLLLISRDFIARNFEKLPTTVLDRGILIADEVHGIGSPTMVSRLSGRLRRFKHRLGLSATPEREYDETGNAFIENEFGPVIFRFTLEEAIERGILCEFDYVALPYSLSDDDKAELRRLIRAHYAAEANGDLRPVETLYQQLARVQKLSTNKLPIFRNYLAANPGALHRSLIFVETMEYGYLVQEIIIGVVGAYHTYYGDDDRENLALFATGHLDCLITCHRISEGIDIKSVRTVILFSTSRARLETIQRLGRCLRVDPDNENKKALVIDFVRDDTERDDEGGIPADEARREWLTSLAKTRRLDIKLKGKRK